MNNKHYFLNHLIETTNQTNEYTVNVYDEANRLIYKIDEIPKEKITKEQFAAREFILSILQMKCA